jgi:phospholipid-binding lipoprotein MlaA
MRAAKVLGILLLGAGLGFSLTACTSAPPSAEALAANDPFETSNRERLAFNAKIDRYVVAPTVGVYFLLVPDAGRVGVHNFLSNLTKPTTLVDDLLQGEVTRGSQTAERFLVNSAFGLGGLFDVATRWNIPDHGEDFGQTLAVWGVGEGPYLVVPFLGPSNPRDGAGLVVDALYDPTNFIPLKNHIWFSLGREYMTIVDLRAQTYETIQGVERRSVDYYASLRSLYRQLRNSEIRNGRPATSHDLPDF